MHRFRARRPACLVAVALMSLALARTPLAASRRGSSKVKFPSLAPEEEYALALRQANVGRASFYSVSRGDFAVLEDGRILLVTSRYALVRGYRGPTVLSIVFDTNGIVTKVSVLRTADTKKFVDRVRRKLPQLLGQSISAEDRRPLAVTGATRTTKGVNATLEEALDTFAKIHRKLTVDADGCRYKGKLLTPREIVTKPAQ